MHYLDHATYSPPSDATVNAVRHAVSELASVGEGTATDLALRWVQLRNQARQRVAKLLGAAADDITLVESTTHGLGVVAGGLPLNAGDNVVVGDCEFLGLPTVWRRHAQDGVEVRAVQTSQGRVTVEDLRSSVDSRTKVLAISAVQEVSGWPADLERIAQLAQRVGAFLLVDGVQEAGVCGRKLSDSGVDAYASGGHKWIRNPYSLGFLWTSQGFRTQLRPPYHGYFALEDPPGGWPVRLGDPEARALDPLPLRATAQALEIGGTPNWLGAVGLDSAVQDLLAIGPADVEAEALALADLLRDGLLRLGIQPMTPPGTRSAIVSFDMRSLRTSNESFVAIARAHGVHLSARGGAGVSGTRSGCHAHNDADDVQALLDLVSHHV